MDITYIKMIYKGWSDLEELWRPRQTDIVARFGRLAEVLQDFSDTREPLIIDSVEDAGQIGLFCLRINFMGKHKLIPLFRQDQLCEMLIGLEDWMLEYCTPSNGISFYEACGKEHYFCIGSSGESALLKLVMLEKYNKVWNGEDWEKDTFELEEG